MKTSKEYINTKYNAVDNTRFDSNNQVVAFPARSVVVKRQAVANGIIVLTYQASISEYEIVESYNEHNDIYSHSVIPTKCKRSHRYELDATRLFAHIVQCRNYELAGKAAY